MSIGKKKHKTDHYIDDVMHDPKATYFQDYPTTKRTFGFIDVCNYTDFTQRHGVHAAAQMLHKFRNAVRIVVGRHGVRVAQWLGDGVMLVRVQPGPVYEAVADLNAIFSNQEFSIHSGISQGLIIIFEGDDYVGKPVNIASRLSDHAQPGEILSYNISKLELPLATQMKKFQQGIEIRGVGNLSDIYSLNRKI